MVSNLLERRDLREYLSDRDLIANYIDPPPGGGTFHATMGRDQPAWIPPTIEALVDLRRLEPNWNSYGARSVDPGLVRAALLLLLDAAGDKEFPAPIVVPTNRGGVQFEWHTRGIDLEIEAKPAGRYHIFFEDTPHNQEWEGDFHSDLQPLVNALDEFARYA